MWSTVREDYTEPAQRRKFYRRCIQKCRCHPVKTSSMLQETHVEVGEGHGNRVRFVIVRYHELHRQFAGGSAAISSCQFLMVALVLFSFCRRGIH
jgi:hypothetical protein